MKKAVPFILSLFLAIGIKAQQIEVYIAKGDVQLKQKGKVVKPTEGLVLDAACTVVLAEKAQLVLYSGEKAVVLTQPGTYTYKDVVSQFEQSKKSITDRYIAYIWNQAHDSESDDPNNGTSKVAGMVSRGGAGIAQFQDSAIVVSENFGLTLTADVVPGKIQVYDRKKPLFTIDADSVFVLVESDSRFSSGKWYGLAAYAGEQPPFDGIVYFKWASPNEVDKFYSSLAELNQSLQDFPDEAIQEITTAFLEDNHYLFFQLGTK